MKSECPKRFLNTAKPRRLKKEETIDLSRVKNVTSIRWVWLSISVVTYTNKGDTDRIDMWHCGGFSCEQTALCPEREAQ